MKISFENSQPGLYVTALAVFPDSIRLQKENNTLVYKFSSSPCHDCFDFLPVLTVFSTIKTLEEGPFKPQVTVYHTYVYRHDKIEYHSLNSVRDITIIVQVKYVSSL